MCALEQDDGARKQRLAIKLEQVVALMTLESWGPHFPGRTGKRPHQKPSCAWAKTCPHLPRPSWLPPSAFQRWLLPWPFFCFLLPKNIFSSSFTLLHKLVSEKTNLKGGSGLRSASSTVQCGGGGGSSSLPQGALEGWMLERWPYWQTSVPLQEEKRGKAFYVAFKNLHW